MFRWLLNFLGLAPNPRPTARQRTIADSWTAERTSAAPQSTPARSVSAQKKQTSASPEALNAAQFTPIGDRDLKEQAKNLGSAWSNPWFGRRDIIPPADDPRTQLIDRAMVTHGFLTREELADIHAVGEEMSEYRPDTVLVSHRANQLVAEATADREELKRQKKAEAEERKRQREEEIAERKRTDIVFLGRGVSKGLADRRANVEELQKNNLPVLATPGELAKAMEFPIPRLRWLAFHTVAAERVHYISFTVPKKSGGERVLSAPHRDMAAAQRWILENILEAVPVHEAAHGFVRKRSTVTNAEPHVGQEMLVGCDLEDFFPSITVFRVMGVFEQLGYSPAVATILALLCTECPRRKMIYAGQTFYAATGPRALPQGACTSPALSNLVCRRLDSRLTGLAKQFGANYTRYADDLTFSGSGDVANMAGWVIAKIRHVVADEGFTLNRKKTRVQRPNMRQTVTGVVVNERPGVPRKLVRRLRAILHNAQTTGLAAQNRENHPHFESWVEGMVSYIQMVNPSQGEPLRAALATIRN
ncbi:reverse transcriptase family protein [Thalassoroseus pseudoceratinae]|uniref:reverse transcriptase family protein n=1 Tax=Thalassoroseus pseudoceratinae TaxID=2713176 RepID=UPI00197F3D69|nr:reverse transcriptase family protein [Thalassoroseus pseudoceratinae]